MTLKELIENNPALVALSLLFVGFASGIGAYDAILRIAHLETVPSSDLKERDQTINQLNQAAAENSQKIHDLIIDNKNLSYEVEDEKRLLSKATLAQLDGTWVNQNADTRGITRFQIEHRGDDIFVHAWGKCHPTDCDWHETKAFVDKDAAIVLWDQSFEFVKMAIRLNKRANMIADYTSIFTATAEERSMKTLRRLFTNRSWQTHRARRQFLLQCQGRTPLAPDRHGGNFGRRC